VKRVLCVCGELHPLAAAREAGEQLSLVLHLEPGQSMTGTCEGNQFANQRS